MNFEFKLGKVFGKSVPHAFPSLAFRLLILLLPARLGWVFGYRFLMLTHIGRKTGQLRRTALEVLRHDDATDTYFVASAWGERPNWFRNVQKTPEVLIQLGGRWLRASAERLPARAAWRGILDYARRHPVLIRIFTRLFGWRTGDTEADILAFAEHTIVLALHPTRQQCSKDRFFDAASEPKATAKNR